MKMIDQFTRRYSLSKTLQFKLIPYGKTLDHFEKNRILENDEILAENYVKVKGYFDRYHKKFIGDGLARLSKRKNALDISEYVPLFYRTSKTDKDKQRLLEIEEELRHEVVAALKAEEKAYKSTISSKEMIRTILPEFLKSKEEREIVNAFQQFSTYFVGFQKNRENLYTEEAKSTGVAFRCINQNLSKYLINADIFKKVWQVLPEKDTEQLENDFSGLLRRKVEAWFDPYDYRRVITQEAIDSYNQLIGGYTLTDGTKIQGINECINRYNQTVTREARLPKLKPLYKQMLSDRESFSFIPEAFESDDEVLRAVESTYTEGILPVLSGLEELISEVDSYDGNTVYFPNSSLLTDLSQTLTHSWSTIKDAFMEKYDAEQGSKKKTDAYFEKREREWKKIAFISFTELDVLLGEERLFSWLCETLTEYISKIRLCYADAETLLTEPYCRSKRLMYNGEDIALIKELLDSIKPLERLIRELSECPETMVRDESFYYIIEEAAAHLDGFSYLYDKVRNYVTQKPYSKDKVKLNFGNSQLLGGWDLSKETERRSVLLRRNGRYYLAIMSKTGAKTFEAYPAEESHGWEKMNYKLLPGPNKMLPKVFFSKEYLKSGKVQPTAEILAIKSRESFKKGNAFLLNDCHKLIRFYQDAIAQHEDWAPFGFVFRKPEEYADISEFYHEVEEQGYKLSFSPISEAYLENKIESGEIYLFQLYCKDFSQNSKGRPNLHTMYFRALFDEDNLRDVVYKLNGEAEMFYRKPSIRSEETVVHYANQPLRNKREGAQKQYSVFPYDLIKDRRYTEPQFFLHVPITMNFKQGKDNLNRDIRIALKNAEQQYVIGIDRGERNLIYVSVIDGKGKIVEQHSFNTISNTVAQTGETHTVDYHALLEGREKDRQDARRNWQAVESIKELKEGYVSQVVHKICELVVKYDAIIAMEDLNVGFKNSRTRVERQVYQKFEKMLIDKLNYLVLKDLPEDACGGVMRAYQLTNPFESFQKIGKQSGIIFYVPAYLTSKIDPTTGFVDLLKPKYTSVEDAKKFIGALDEIRYLSNEDLFAISFDYRNFPGCGADSKNCWTVYTVDRRVYYNRVRRETETVVLTDAMKELFDRVGIDHLAPNLKERILAENSKDFFERFLFLLRMTLQMRNTTVEEDFMISPVKNCDGVFFDSRKQDPRFPIDADANGAYHIGKKALWIIQRLKEAEDEALDKVKLAISNQEWLAFAQNDE